MTTSKTTPPGVGPFTALVRRLVIGMTTFAMLCCVPVDLSAQGRGRGNQGGHQPQRTAQKGGKPSRGGEMKKYDKKDRKDRKGDFKPNRGNGKRKDNNSYKPDKPNKRNYDYSNSYKRDKDRGERHNAHPYRHDNGNHYGHFKGPRPPRFKHGYRHPVPFFGHYRRPVPPPRWHFGGHGPSFGTILGVALGATIYNSIDLLLNNGYTINNYGDDVIYLSNVPQLGYTWPSAAMYYTTGGLLTGSMFTYPTPYYDMGRYDALYGRLCRDYGPPIERFNRGGVIRTTWFGSGGRYVSLEFNSNYGNYYTSLSFGN